MDTLQITTKLKVPLGEVQLSFERSPGPGGQHVNKNSTQVELRFDVRQSPSLSTEERRRLLEGLANRLTQEGVLILRSSRFRSQWRNREDCLNRFVELLAEKPRPPPPPRRPTKPSRRAKARRREAKKHHSNKKALRRRPADD